MLKAGGGGGGTTDESQQPAGAATGGGGAGGSGLKKGPWTAAEDAILIDYVKKHGEGNWNSVQKNSGLLRCGKSCRLRWANHLRPNLKKGSFSPDEELLILQLHAQLGNKWARMAAQLPGRTDNEIKNYWNTRIKRRQRAGLPLYPSDGQHRQPNSSSPRPPPPSLSLFDHAAAMGGKRYRDGGMTFHLPLSPAAAAASNSMFKWSNYEMGAAPPPASYTLKMELPSTQQLYDENGGDGGSGLLDALLKEAQDQAGGPPGKNQEDLKWAQVGVGVGADNGRNDGGGGNKDPFMESVCKLGDLDWSIGINPKRQRTEEMSPPPAQDDMSNLLDMIPTQGMPAAPEWYNSDSGGEMSNGGQSSVVTDDELGLEIQQLASSLSIAPVDQEWNIASCQWNNLPRIC